MQLEFVKGILEPCQALCGYIAIQPEQPKSIAVQLPVQSAKPVRESSSKPIRGRSKDRKQVDSSDDAMIENLKSIFPSYGRAFLLACLKVSFL
jgi:hypothetical protein